MAQNVNEEKGKDLASLLLRSAASLRLEINGRNETYEFKKKYERDSCAFILYAVDTDIVISHTNPVEASRNSHYASKGNIFPNDSQDVETTRGLISTLAHFIFDDLDTNWPIFQLPPHHIETQSVFAKVAERTRRDYKGKAKAQLLLAEESERNLQKEKNSSNLMKDYTSQEVTKNVSTSVLKVAKQIIQGHQKSQLAVEELKNYFQLVSSGCALGLESGMAITENDESLYSVHNALSAGLERSGDEYRKFHTLTNLWIIRLAKQKSHLKRSKFIIDAEALATLEIINERLPENGRMILITADTALLDAARSDCEFGCKDEFGQEYFSEFARKHIRHFHTFFADCLVESNQTDHEKFENWLDGFLGRWSSTYRYNDDALYKLASGEEQVLELKDISEAEVLALLSDWRAFREYAVNWTLVRQNLVDNEASYKKIANQIETVRDVNDLKELLTEIETSSEQVKQSIWEEFVLDLSQTGTEFLFHGNVRPARHSPNIRFDSLTYSSDIFQKLQSGQYYNNSKLFEKDLEKVSQQTTDDKPTQNALGYLYYLIFAGAFSQASKWATALSLAQRAIHIIESTDSEIYYPEQGSLFSGREAYYMAAIACRICARNLHDINDARKFLGKAFTALERDHGANTALNIKGIRFEIEALSVELSQIYLASFYLKKLSTPQITIEELTSLQKEAERIWDRCIQACSVPENKHLKLSLPIIGVNCLQVMSFRYALRSDEDINEASNLIKGNSRFDAWVSSLDSIETSDALPGSYLLASYKVLSEALQGKKPNIYKHFSEQNISKACVTRYDKPRFNWLLSLCESIR